MSSHLSFHPPDSGRAASALTDRDGLYAAETAYLDHMIGLEAARIARLQDNDHSGEDAHGVAAWPGEEQLTAAYQAARGILESLRNDPDRAERTLEGLLGDSLRATDQQLTQISHVTQGGSSYSATFWQLEQERNIRATILRHWWHWLRGDPVSV